MIRFFHLNGKSKGRATTAAGPLTSDSSKELAGLVQHLQKVTEQVRDFLLQDAQSRKESFLFFRGVLFRRKPAGGFERSVYCPHCRMPMQDLKLLRATYCGLCRVNVDLEAGQILDALRELEVGRAR